MNWVLKSTQPANHPNQLPDTGSVTTLGWGLVTKFAWFLPWNPDILPDCLIYLGFYHSYQTIIWTDIYHNYHFTIKYHLLIYFTILFCQTKILIWSGECFTPPNPTKPPAFPALEVSAVKPSPSAVAWVGHLIPGIHTEHLELWKCG